VEQIGATKLILYTQRSFILRQVKGSSTNKFDFQNFIIYVSDNEIGVACISDWGRERRLQGFGGET
jgi:hypothetical protein